MQVSPGIELVWTLAVGETKAARMKEIEPEHFFLALLKFPELKDDELEAVAVRPKVAQGLVVERDIVKDILEKRSLPTKRTRRQLRRVLGRGSYQHEDKVIHRSQASREFFDRAANAARKGEGILNSECLLQVLVENPTSTIAGVMQDVGMKAPTATGSTETPKLSRYLIDILKAAPASGYKVPAFCQPQVQVLARDLQSGQAAPILLRCAPRVHVESIVGCVAQDLEDRIRIAEIDYLMMLGEGEDKEEFVARMAYLLAESAGTENLVLFADAREQEGKHASLLMSALEPALTNPVTRLVIAVRDLVELDPAMGGVLRTIWFHELDGEEVPTEL